MFRAYATRLAPETLDRLILAGLRMERGPVDEAAIPDLCRLRYHSLPQERQDSLDRLVAGGLVSRRVVRTPHPERPLFDWIQTTVYQAIGGDT